MRLEVAPRAVGGLVVEVGPARCASSRGSTRGSPGRGREGAGWGRVVIPQGGIFVAVEPVDMRFGFERLGGLVREQMGREPRSKALFVFFGKRRQTVEILTWDGTGAVLWYKRLDRGVFEIPRPEREGETSVIVSESAFRPCSRGSRRQSTKMGKIFAMRLNFRRSATSNGTVKRAMRIPPETAKLVSALAERDAAIASRQALIASLQGTIAALESALTNHASENELLKRRLYGTKSERSGTSELQLARQLARGSGEAQAGARRAHEATYGDHGRERRAGPAPEPAPSPRLRPRRPRARSRARRGAAISPRPSSRGWWSRSAMAAPRRAAEGSMTGRRAIS